MKSAQCFYFSEQTNLQRNVSSVVWNKLFSISKDHYEDNGISLRVHGNHGRLPPNATSQKVNEEVKNFLTNYVEENAVLLPGRIPGFKKEDIKLLCSKNQNVCLAPIQQSV